MYINIKHKYIYKLSVPLLNEMDNVLWKIGHQTLNQLFIFLHNCGGVEVVIVRT